MINPNDGKRDPKAPKTYGMAIGASRGMRAGTAGEAVNTGFREGIGQKPTPVGDDRNKKKPTDKSKIKPEAYKAYILARGKR
jgi:hypothetical protein